MELCLAQIIPLFDNLALTKMSNAELVQSEGTHVVSANTRGFWGGILGLSFGGLCQGRLPALGPRPLLADAFLALERRSFLCLLFFLASGVCKGLGLSLTGLFELSLSLFDLERDDVEVLTVRKHRVAGVLLLQCLVTAKQVTKYKPSVAQLLQRGSVIDDKTAKLFISGGRFVYV